MEHFLGAVSGGPSQHSSSRSARGFSAELVNITTTFESGTTTPRPTTPLMKPTGVRLEKLKAQTYDDPYKILYY